MSETVAVTPGDDDALPDPDAPIVTEPETAPEPEAPRVPVFKVVVVGSVVVELPSQFPVVNLHEEEPPFRFLSFPVSLQDGAAIAAVLEDKPPLRPLTHEFLALCLKRANVDVVAARIVSQRDGNLVAEVDLMTQQGRHVIECRPSDAINIALRQTVRAPLLVDEELFD